MEGPQVSFAGKVNAPAGNVSAIADYFDLILKAGSEINAAAYNKPDTASVMTGYPVGYTPMAGGQVTLQAAYSLAKLVLEKGSVVDVSGSDPVTTYVKSSLSAPQAYTVAGAPGEYYAVILSEDLTLQGELRGWPRMAGLPGGSLTIKSQDPAGLTSNRTPSPCTSAAASTPSPFKTPIT